MGNPGSLYLCGYVFFDHKTLKSTTSQQEHVMDYKFWCQLDSDLGPSEVRCILQVHVMILRVFESGFCGPLVPSAWVTYRLYEHLCKLIINN